MEYVNLMGNVIDFVNNMSEEDYEEACNITSDKSEEELLEWFDKEFGMKIEIKEKKTLTKTYKLFITHNS